VSPVPGCCSVRVANRDTQTSQRGLATKEEDEACDYRSTGGSSSPPGCAQPSIDSFKSSAFYWWLDTCTICYALFSGNIMLLYIIRGYGESLCDWYYIYCFDELLFDDKIFTAFLENT
jgi:hypothetical protein